jgi:hypothetical protein
MTAPDPYPCKVDPLHVGMICATAAPGSPRGGTPLLTGGRYGVRVYLPSRSAARAAQDALRRVGYRVGRAAETRRGRDLIVAGWSADGLDSRLAAMRGVLQRLAAGPGSTAAAALDQLGRLPAAALPGEAGQQQLIRQAGYQLREWISATSGIHAPCNRLATPADTGIALRLSAAWRAEEAIDGLAVRHLQVTELAVGLYPALRQAMSHDSARDSAIRRAGIAAHITRHVDRDISPLMRGDGRGAGRAETDAGLAGPGLAGRPARKPGSGRSAGPRGSSRLAAHR